LGAALTDALVPHFSTDDVSAAFPQLCIGCAEGRSLTQHALKKENPGRRQQQQQQQ
jgi:hypothetical protein